MNKNLKKFGYDLLVQTLEVAIPVVIPILVGFIKGDYNFINSNDSIDDLQ